MGRELSLLIACQVRTHGDLRFVKLRYRTTGFGPLLISFAYDRTHSYSGVLWGYIPLSVLTALLFASLGRYPVFAAPAAVATRSGDEIGV